MRIQKRLQVPDEEFLKVRSLPYTKTNLTNFILIKIALLLFSFLYVSPLIFFLLMFFMNLKGIISFQISKYLLDVQIFFFLLFLQWKFAFLSLGRPEYLQDSDVVSTRFQVLSLIFKFCTYRFY